MKIPMQPLSEMLRAWGRLGLFSPEYVDRIAPLLQGWEARGADEAAKPPSWWMAL